MKNTVRYILNQDGRIVHTVNGKVELTPTKFNYFVDLLEPIIEGICEPVKVKIYSPDGDILIGTVMGCGISIFNKDALFDGRFNA